MDYIIKNEMYEEIRIKQGLVLKIQKYKALSYKDFYSTELKGKVKKVGEKLYELKIDITRNEWSKGEITYPAGTKIMNSIPITKCDAGEFRYEITSSGGSIFGEKDNVIKTLKDIIKNIENN